MLAEKDGSDFADAITIALIGIISEVAKVIQKVVAGELSVWGSKSRSPLVACGVWSSIRRRRACTR